MKTGIWIGLGSLAFTLLIWKLSGGHFLVWILPLFGLSFWMNHRGIQKWRKNHSDIEE